MSLSPIKGVDRPCHKWIYSAVANSTRTNCFFFRFMKYLPKVTPEWKWVHGGWANYHPCSNWTRFSSLLVKGNPELVLKIRFQVHPKIVPTCICWGSEHCCTLCEPEKPLKIGHVPKDYNHWFSGLMLVSGRVGMPSSQKGWANTMIPWLGVVKRMKPNLLPDFWSNWQFTQYTV